MAVPRYYRVIMGHRGDDAKDRFITWLKSRGQNSTGNRNSGRTRPEKIALYLNPFSLELAATQRLKASAEAPSWARVTGVAAVTSRVSSALPTNGVALPIKKFKAARVVVKTGQTSTGTIKNSHITGLSYKDYGGSSFSIPFGKSTDSETELQAMAAIKAALVAANVATESKINFTQEDI